MQRGRKYDLEIEACEQIQNVHKSEKIKSYNTPMEESNIARQRKTQVQHLRVGGREGE